MSNEKMGVGMSSSSTATRKGRSDNYGLGLFDVFHVECYSADGELKWVDDIHNAVTNEGLAYTMNALFYGGTQYTENVDWYIGLVDINPTDPTYTDTAAAIATSVMGVAEYTEYDEAGRQILNLNAAGTPSGGTVTNSNSSAVASFTISSPGTDVGGCFIVAGTGAGTKGSNVSPGVLYGAGAFSAGNKTVDTGDTLNVTVNVTAASA
jgi:hypothetical protein